jgi:hypothetical protein
MFLIQYTRTAGYVISVQGRDSLLLNLSECFMNRTNVTECGLILTGYEGMGQNILGGHNSGCQLNLI